MGIYAAQTTVSSEKSRAEIERTLARYGATGFMYGWKDSNAVVAFQMHSKMLKFVLPLPDKSDKSFWTTPTGRKRRHSEDALVHWEQACRQRWRALALSIKAKLEAVESGISLFEEEFMAHIVLPGGQTFGEYALPRIEAACVTGKFPQLTFPTG